MESDAPAETNGGAAPTSRLTPGVSGHVVSASTFERLLAETCAQAIADGNRNGARALLINYDPRRAILTTLDTLNVMLESASDGEDIIRMIEDLRALIAGTS
jgi:hypothetical protein